MKLNQKHNLKYGFEAKDLLMGALLIAAVLGGWYLYKHYTKTSEAKVAKVAKPAEVVKPAETKPAETKPVEAPKV